MELCGRVFAAIRDLKVYDFRFVENSAFGDLCQRVFAVGHVLGSCEPTRLQSVETSTSGAARFTISSGI